ncbi:hypothetical protein R3I93_005519 [Phoxinus phoxinus]|uniref:Macro domain-containing protein n=1 Tax=Phoxinus phoxinus TaxID=58324 RepID=A0AAN9DCQ0_9TELE
MEERSLILEGLPDDFDRVKSKVELYFKNKRRSGGEIEQIREHQDDKRKALLIYMSEEDLKKVLDKRIHKVDFKSKGAVEVTVKLPEDTKSKKIKPLVLPKPKLEKNALLKSLPAPANQVSAARQPATEIKDNEEDSEIPDLLITTPSLTLFDKETLQMYFEQFTEQFELAKHGNNSWILKLYSQSDFKEIFGKEEHDIGVSLQVYNERSLGGKSDPRRFILTGFDGDTDCKKISVFIGSCSKTTEHTWETLDDDDMIVVTFKQDIDVKSFIRKCTSKQLQGRDIGVTRMERTDSILVQGDLEKISEEILTLYFTNKKKSRGGDIENFTWIDRRMSAVITFGNCDDAHATVEQKHSVCGTEVHASLFYSSLRKALTGEKPSLTDTTTKVNISVSEDLLLFFETNERCRKELESDAKRLHAKVSMDSTALASEIILEMDVNKESLKARQIAPTWESKIKRGVESFLSGYDTEELTVDEDVWRKVEKDCDVLVTVDTAFSFKERNSKVVISGVNEQVRILSDKIRTLLTNAAVEVEVERNTIEATIQLDCRETFDLIKERVQSKLGQVSLSHDEKHHVISLKGLKEKVNSVEMLIKNAQKNIITHQLKLSSHLIDFLKSLDLHKFEKDNHIPARFLNRKDFFGILVEKENLKGAQDKIGEILKEEVIQISPNQTGLTRFLGNLQDEIEKANDIRIAQSNMQVIICGLSNAVADVTGKVRRYLKNKEPTTENVPLKSVREVEFVESCLNLSDLPELKRLGASILACKASNSPCLKVTAPNDNIKDAVDVVQRKLSSIAVEKHKYCKAGEAKVLEKHKDNVKTKAREKQCTLYLSQEHIVALPKSFTHRIGDFMTLSISEGDLHHFTADALICTMNGNLDFNKPMAQRFLKFGGDKILEVCETPKKEKQSLLPGDVLVSDAGKLNAEMLIYAVLPQKGQALDLIYLQSSVRNCLLKAEGKGCVSIAMPAIGCETFGFSVKESCVAIRAAVLQFCSEHQNSQTNIRNISVVDSDEKIVEECNALIQELV